MSGYSLLSAPTLKTCLRFLGGLALALVGLKLFEVVVATRLRRLAGKTKSQLNGVAVSVFERLGWPFYLVTASYLAVKLIDLPPAVSRTVTVAASVILAYYLVVSLGLFLDYALNQALKSKAPPGRQPDPLITKVLTQLLKAALWIGAGLVLLQNLGINVSAVVGGLGLGGIAVAFALKEILGDILAYFSIHLDRPFQEGDSIVVGQDRGKVKHIGLKSTRLQTPQGEELIIPNRDLTESRLRHLKTMKKRRVVFHFTIAPNTPVSQLKKIPHLIKKIFVDRQSTELDRVHLVALGDLGFNYEVVYYFVKPGYKAYLDTQQAINLSLLSQFTKAGIRLAYSPRETIVYNN